MISFSMSHKHDHVTTRIDRSLMRLLQEAAPEHLGGHNNIRRMVHYCLEGFLQHETGRKPRGRYAPARKVRLPRISSEPAIDVDRITQKVAEALRGG